MKTNYAPRIKQPNRTAGRASIKEILGNGVILYWSYATVIGIKGLFGGANLCVVTNKKYSRTTTKHTGWIYNDCGYRNVRVMDDDLFRRIERHVRYSVGQIDDILADIVTDLL